MVSIISAKQHCLYEHASTLMVVFSSEHSQLIWLLCTPIFKVTWTQKHFFSHQSKSFVLIFLHLLVTQYTL